MCITKQATKTIHLCTASDPTTACSRARLCTQLLVTSNWLWAKIKKCCMYLSCALDLLSLYVSLQHEQGKREESVPLQCTHWLTAHENTPAVDQPGSEWVSGWVSEYRWVSGWVSEWVGEWVNEWVSEWVSEWVNIGEWVGEWVSEWVSWMSRWMSGWVSEWVSEWMSKCESMNEWVDYVVAIIWVPIHCNSHSQVSWFGERWHLK